MNEQWLPIPGYDGYDASDQGRIRSWKKRGSGFGGDHWGTCKNSPPKTLKPGTKESGHLFVGLGKGTVKNVHTLVLLSFIGPRPHNYQGSHINGDPKDNRLQNLLYETVSENMSRVRVHATDPQFRGGKELPNTQKLFLTNGGVNNKEESQIDSDIDLRVKKKHEAAMAVCATTTYCLRVDTCSYRRRNGNNG